PAMRELMERLRHPARGSRLHVANRLFPDAAYPLEPAYLGLVEAAFGTALAAVDFQNQPERARAEINDWVTRETEDRIQELIPPKGVDRDTRLVLANAIAFLGAWADPFDAGSTASAYFFPLDGTAKQVPTMHDMGERRTGRVEDTRVLELLY